MSAKKQNMIEQAVTALNRIADTLDDMDTAIWTMALEAAEIHDKIESLDTKLDKLLSEGLKVTVDFKTFTENIAKQTPKPETAEPPKEAFPTAE